MRTMLDHVAIRVMDRAATTAELLNLLEVEVIEQTERFTLIGPHADFGKITLLDAEGDEAPSAERIVALMLTGGVHGASTPPIELKCGLRLTFVDAAQIAPHGHDLPQHALVGMSLRASDPSMVAAELKRMHGMHIDSVGAEVAMVSIGEAGNGRISISRERWDSTRPALLDHIGFRISDVNLWEHEAIERGIEVVRRVEAPHSTAVFVTGPEQLLLEYVELTAAFQSA
ncbi:MAG: hypothetical protein ABI200_04485 [Gaiellales bacterium]